MASALPIIDLQALTSVDALGKALVKAGSSPGFLYLIGHGIPEDLIANLFSVSKTFFLETPAEEKMEFLSQSGEPGYSPIRLEKLSGSGRGDLKESFHFNSLSSAANRNPALPSKLQKHKEELEIFCTHCERVGKVLLRGFAAGLNLPFDFLDKQHTGEQNRFRMLHYPAVFETLVAPISQSDQDEPGATNEGEPLDIRAGAHSDYGSLTLLFQQADDKGGLQVLEGEGGGKTWKDVPALQNAIVVNIGDALEFWTAGRLRSTIHRVTFPRSEGEARSRFSIPFFIQPNDDTLLSPMHSVGSESGDLNYLEQENVLFEELLKSKGYLLDTNSAITAYTHRTARESSIQASPAQVVV